MNPTSVRPAGSRWSSGLWQWTLVAAVVAVVVCAVGWPWPTLYALVVVLAVVALVAGIRRFAGERRAARHGTTRQSVACGPACAEGHTYQAGCGQYVPGGWTELLGVLEPDADESGQDPEETVPCAGVTVFRQPHPAHDWTPQPEATAVHCTGYGIAQQRDTLATAPDPALVQRVHAALRAVGEGDVDPGTGSDYGDQTAAVLAVLAPELAALADYRACIDWDTTCTEHARLLGQLRAAEETIEAAKRVDGPWIRAYREDLTDARDAIRRARRLHRSDDAPSSCCTGCGHPSPCPTVRALTLTNGTPNEATP